MRREAARVARALSVRSTGVGRLRSAGASASLAVALAKARPRAI
jgi:hypothetical protein